MLSTKFEDAETDRCLRVESKGTISGRCFVVINRCPMKAKQTLMLEMNLTEV